MRQFFDTSWLRADPNLTFGLGHKKGNPIYIPAQGIMCDYVYPRHNGLRCGVVHCKIHKDKCHGPAQKIYNIFIGNNKKITTSNLLECCRRLTCDKDIIDTIIYIFDAPELARIADCLPLSQRRSKSKMHIATSIASYYKNLAILACKYITSIIWLQRRYRMRLRGYPCNSRNTEDPFTLMSLHDLSLSELFAFKDNTNQVWAFSAPDLFYYISSTHTNDDKPKNPFTRDVIPDEAVHRLRIVMSNCSPQTFTLDSCTTIDQMYTYVIGFFDQQGFYLQNRWFTRLSTRNLCAIANIFEPCANVNSHREFVQLMLRIAEGPHDTRFVRMCLLVSLVAKYNPGVEASLPEWVFTAASVAMSLA